MRCTNCGYMNSAEVSNCIKCNSALNGSKSEAPKQPRENVRKQNFSSTLPDADYPAGEPYAEPVFQEPEAVTPEWKCSCGYPNSSLSKVCAVCGKSAGEPKDMPAPKPAEPRVPTMPPPSSGMPAGNNKAFSGTIDPFRAPKAQNAFFCFLKLVDRDEENRSDSNTGIKEFTTDLVSPVVLNRDNLDADNRTITSKIQAQLSFENGKWTLEDKSDLHTTFIRVRGKIELEDGDMILMGDRKFIFSSQIDNL